MRPTVAQLLEMLRPFRRRSEGHAHDALLELAYLYQHAVAQHEAAPRRSKVIQELELIAAAAHALAGTLRAASPHVVELLAGNLLPVAVVDPSPTGLPWSRDPRDKLRETAGIAPGRWNTSDGQGWVYRLAPEEAAEAVLGRLDSLATLARGIAADVPPDKGGRGNLYSEQWSNPKATLALDVFKLFVSCRPADSEQVDGPLLDFACSVLRWVSDGREDGESIRPYLQHMAAWARGFDPYRARIAALRVAITTCTDGERGALEGKLADELGFALGAPPRALVLCFNPPPDGGDHRRVVFESMVKEPERVTGLVRKENNPPEIDGG